MARKSGVYLLPNLFSFSIVQILLLSLVPIEQAKGNHLDRVGTQWAPFLEWSLDNPTFSGNPYDLIASGTFVHTGSGETRTTEMFYAGGTTWKFRFTGTRTGTWTFTTASPDPDLDAQSGVVTINPNPNPLIKGFLTTQGKKFARQVGSPDDLEGFIPNVYMNLMDFGNPEECGWMDITPTLSDPATRSAYLDEVQAHGANGAFAIMLNQWFKAHQPSYDTHSSVDPDPETFAALEAAIVQAHQRGLYLHIWAWGDEARQWTPIGVGGINGTPDQRLQRYIAARLGPLPGWMMSYGFDLEEWASEAQVQTWAEFLQQHMGWGHLVMGRDRTNAGVTVESNDVRPSGSFYQDAVARLTTASRPIMYERRFAYLRDGVWTMENTRRAFWQFTLAGGAGSMWGFYPPSCVAFGGQPYPNPEQLQTHAQFWQDRFLVDFEPADTLTDGHALKTPANTHYVFYKENTSTISMDLSSAVGVLPAIAVDTKLSYVEIDFGALSATNQTWTAPYQSDWAVAVGGSRPLAGDDAYSGNEGTVLTVGAPGVLSNDSDPENDPLTAVLGTGPTNGTLTLQSDGSFTYTPNPGFSGTDSFTYQADDGQTLSNVATVALNINGRPVAGDDTAITPVATPIGILVLANDTDDGALDPATVTVGTLPTNGATAVDGGTGVITYTPTVGFSGTDSFTYTVADTAGLVSNAATVTVTVTTGNIPPVAGNDAYSGNEGTVLTVGTPGVLSNDSDPNNDPLTAVLSTGPANGTLTLQSDGSFVYTPNLGFSGTDSFTYQANDGQGFSNVATVTITVNEGGTQGPGLGNLSYSSFEVFTPISIINSPLGHGNVAMVNGYLMVIYSSDGGGNSGNGGIEFWDVSDPRNPVLAVWYDNADTHGLREPHGFGFSNSYPKEYLVTQAVEGIQFWDVTDPLNISLVNYLDLPGISQGDYSGAWWVFWQAPYVYVAGVGSGLYVVDATDPVNPVLLNQIPTSQMGLGPNQVFAVGNLLVLTQGGGGTYATMDISDPGNPTLIQVFGGKNGYSHIFAAGKILSSGGNGHPPKLYVHDVTHEGVISFDGEVGSGLGNGGYGSYQDGFFHSGFSSKYAKFDISTLTQLGTGSSGLPGRDEDFGQVLGNLVFLGDDHGQGSALIVHQSQPDTNGPEVHWANPKDGAINMSLTSRVGLSMSDNIDIESVNASTFTVRPLGGNPLTGKYSVQMGLVNFTPDSPLQPDTVYEIVVSGMKDWVGNSGGIFTSQFSTGASLPGGGEFVSNITAGSGLVYQVDLFTVGKLAFLDEPYAFTNEYPTIFEGRDYIRTANADSNGTGSNFLTFDLASPASVYVLYDDGASQVPAWLGDGSWTLLSETVGTTQGSRAVYQKDFPAGTVTLGGNADPPMTGANSMYNVLIVPTSTGGPPTCTLGPLQKFQVNGAANFDVGSVSGSTPLTYTWDFGDGSPLTLPSSEPTATHPYTAPGRYGVLLTVQNAFGSGTCSAVQIIHNPLTPAQPSASSPIVHNGSWSFSVNPDNDSVTAIEETSLTKIWESSVGKNPRTLALAPNEDLWVVNQDDATISVLNPLTGSVVNTLSLPYASRPYGLAFSPDGSAAYVTLQGTGRLLQLDVAGNVVGEIFVGPQPRGIAISGDSSRILVTRFISPTDHAEVWEVDASTFTITRTLDLAFDPGPDTEASGRGVPNYLTTIRISPDGQRAFVPSKKDNIARGLFLDGQPLTFESRVRIIVSQIDLQANTEDLPSRIDFNDREMAQSVVFSPVGDIFFVAFQGTNIVEVFDSYTGARLGTLNTGFAPQGMALNSDGSKLFVHNFLSRSVSIFDVQSFINGTSNSGQELAEVNTVASEKLSPQVLEGKQVFYNASDPRMSQDGYISCAGCHLGGGSDGQVWDFTQVGEGLRNTITLRGRAGIGHGNVHWTANFDEIQDFENDIRGGFGGLGFLTDSDFANTSDPLGNLKAGLNATLDALAAYVSSLTTVPPSPYRNPDGTLTPDGEAGKQIFLAQNCYSCHSGPSFTDSQRHDVGTIQPSSGQGIGQPLEGLGFETPTLKGVWNTPPYFHNGQAATLLDVVTHPTHGVTSGLTSNEIQQLVAYLLQIDENEPGLGGLVANDDFYGVAQNSSLTIVAPGVVINDVNPSGSPLNTALINGPSNGSLNLQPNGGFTYTPNPGFSGTDSFTYQADDGQGLSNVATVTLSINGRPVAGDDTATTTEGTAVGITVLANDTDDGTLNPATVTVGTPPANGTTTVDSGTGVITYTPNPGFNGTDSFTYTVADTAGLVSNEATVTVTVLPSPQGGLISNVSVANGKAYEVGTFTAGQLVYIDRGYTYTSGYPGEVEGQEYIRTANNDKNGMGASFLTVELAAAARVYVLYDIRASQVPGWLGDGTWAVQSGVVGTTDVDHVIYYKDFPAGSVGLGGNADAPMAGAGSMYSVVVSGGGGPGNTAPVAGDDTYSGDEGVALTVGAPGVLGNDSDPENDPFTAVLSSGPASGTLTLPSDGSFTYTPNPGFSGTDSFAYQADDGQGLSNVATVTLSINGRPVAGNDTATTTEGTAVGITVLANDTDDGALDPATVTVRAPPANGTTTVESGTGVITYTPNPGFSGLESFTYTVADTLGLVSTAATVTMTVLPSPQGGLILNVSVANGKGYEVDTFTAGQLVYIDRGYTYTSQYPGELEGQEYIRTANNDKFGTGASFLTFELAAAARVYVLYDSRASQVPGWLGDGTWAVLSGVVGTTDVAHVIYYKDFPVGSVGLGGNADVPMVGASSMYSVVVISNGPG
ncbi:MAG: tandem-95 repeat protein [Nitrospinae bacterium]|nr:tandem-95 repeat protein [Nitrospinota bacterium]